LGVERDECYIANGILSANSHGGDSFSYGGVALYSASPSTRERDGLGLVEPFAAAVPKVIKAIGGGPRPVQRAQARRALFR
jgi:hypothetical protein